MNNLRTEAKARGRGNTIRRFLQKPIVCLYCGAEFGKTRRELAHHILFCADHPAHRFTRLFALAMAALHIPEREHGDFAMLPELTMAAVFLRQTGGERQLASARHLERLAGDLWAIVEGNQVSDKPE